MKGNGREKERSREKKEEEENGGKEEGKKNKRGDEEGCEKIEKERRRGGKEKSRKKEIKGGGKEKVKKRIRESEIEDRNGGKVQIGNYLFQGRMEKGAREEEKPAVCRGELEEVHTRETRQSGGVKIWNEAVEGIKVQ
ncbi:hypothetical protein Tco_0280544 [Tanacetum coccineum]|uniref:Uncharacterized protein n=1 Tax=Tanacetum coccineum TaxID=301880 RepID=A0ABQ5DJC5_9ASTR